MGGTCLRLWRIQLGVSNCECVICVIRAANKDRSGIPAAGEVVLDYLQELLFTVSEYVVATSWSNIDAEVNSQFAKLPNDLTKGAKSVSAVVDHSLLAGLELLPAELTKTMRQIVKKL